MSKVIGGRFIILDAKTDELCEWYRKMGFRSLNDNARRMVLPMKDAALPVRSLGEGHFRF